MKKRSRQGLLSLFVLITIAFIFVLWQETSFPERFLFAESDLILEDLQGGDVPSVRLAATGDVRSSGWSQELTANLLSHIHEKAPLHGIVLLGDNASLWGNPRKVLQKDFLDPFASLLTQPVPFYAILGNHDLRNGMKEYQLNFPHFNMEGRPYYSKVFDEDCVEIFFINSNKMSKDLQQVQWLRQALSDSKANWKVVAMHHPLYATTKHRNGSNSLSKLLEPIFVQNDVDLVLSGHNHIYERLYPMNGITYITAGSGGELRRGELQPDNPLRAAGDDQDNVALLLEFTPDTCRFSAYTGFGKLVDRGVLEKNSAEYAGLKAGLKERGF